MAAFRTHACAWLALLLVGSAARADADTGADFVEDAKRIYRVVACGGDAALPSNVDPKAVARHCATIKKRIQTFRRKYYDKATPFLARLRPAKLPAKVVYPFGGGDMVSALITYPDASEITTISLEHAGDATRLSRARASQVNSALKVFERASSYLLWLHHNKSKWLRKLERGPIPSQLSMALLGMVAVGYEPVSLRYFRIEPGGTLHYYTRAEIDKLAGRRAKAKGYRWQNTDHSVVYSNMELKIRRLSDKHEVTYRHIAFNLDNRHFKGSGLHKHLEAKGKVCTMTKAASYLLYRDDFSAIRTYLIDYMAFMFSDATGIPARIARKHKLKQVTFGRYAGTFHPHESFKAYDPMLRRHWKSQPYRKLPFKYGYADAHGRAHMMITTPDTTYTVKQ